MKIAIAACIAALFAVQPSTAPAADAKQPKKIHVPESLSALRPISAAAQNVNHIVLVNVGNAIPSQDWPLAANFAVSRIQVNIWTNSLDATLFPGLLSDRSELTAKFGSKAKLVVFVEDFDGTDAYQTAQGAWCRVNLKPLMKDNPDRQTRLDRYAKAILKGIAYAGGCGAGYDNMSVTGYKTITLEGLDAAGICITPETYFPMLESMRIIGGDAMLSPAVSESE